MNFVFGKKEFRVADFDNELTLRQGKYGSILFTKFFDNLSKLHKVSKKAKNVTSKNNDEMMLQVIQDNMKAMADNIDIEFYCQMLAVVCFEKTKDGWEFIDENLENNTKLFLDNIKAKDMEVISKVAKDFFTFIPRFTMVAFQMHSAGITEVIGQIQPNSENTAT